MSSHPMPGPVAATAAVYGIVAAVLGVGGVVSLVADEIAPAVIMALLAVGVGALVDGLRRGFRGARVVGLVMGVLIALGGVQFIDVLPLVGFAVAVSGAAVVIMLAVPSSSRDWFGAR